MKSKILGLLAVGLLAGPMAAKATVVYQFSLAANGNVGSVEIRWTTDTFVPDGDILIRLLDDPSISYSYGAPLDPAESRIGFDQDPTETLFGILLHLDIGRPFWVLFTPDHPRDFFAFTRTFDQEGTFSSTRGRVISDLSLQTGNPVGTLCVSSTGQCDVPEPASLALLGLGLAGLGLSRRRKA